MNTIPQRIETARAVTAGQDGKASAQLGAVGVLLTAGGIATALAKPTGFVAILVVLAALATAGSVIALVLALVPRGGSPAQWLLGTQTPAAELAKLARIAGIKHRCLQLAALALVVATVLGMAAVALGVAR